MEHLCHFKLNKFKIVKNSSLATQFVFFILSHLPKVSTESHIEILPYPRKASKLD